MFSILIDDASITQRTYKGDQFAYLADHGHKNAPFILWYLANLKWWWNMIGHSSLRLSALAAGLMLLLGCGGGSGGAVTQAPSFEDTVDAFESGFDDASNGNFSTAGSVSAAAGTYSGQALLTVIDGADTQFFLGTTALTVDIGAGTVSGSLSDFAGGLIDETPEELQGDLTVTGVSIARARASDFVSSVAGTLTGPETNIDIGTGSLLGDFIENPTIALFAKSTSTNTTLNGTTGLTSTLDVLGEKD